MDVRESRVPDVNIPMQSVITAFKRHSSIYFFLVGLIYFYESNMKLILSIVACAILSMAFSQKDEKFSLRYRKKLEILS